VGTLHVERILVGVEIDIRVGAEVHRIGAGDECAIVVIGIEHLHGKRFPATGGTPVQEPRPALADATKLFFDRRDQFRFNGIAVRAEIGGVDGVGIVVKGIGVIDFSDKNARKIGARPSLVELVGLFLLNPVVSGNVKSFAVVRFQIGVRRLGAETVKILIEMIFENCKGIPRVGMRVKALRDEDIGAEIERASPEPGKQRRLDP